MPGQTAGARVCMMPLDLALQDEVWSPPSLTKLRLKPPPRLLRAIADLVYLNNHFFVSITFIFLTRVSICPLQLYHRILEHQISDHTHKHPKLPAILKTYTFTCHYLYISLTTDTETIWVWLKGATGQALLSWSISKDQTTGRIHG